MMQFQCYKLLALVFGCSAYLESGERNEGIGTANRLRRSLFALGKKAAKTLLKDAAPMDSGINTAKKIYFYKFGGYKRAAEDFYSVKPAAIRNVRQSGIPGGVFKGGRVGDRTLTLTKGDKDMPVAISITKTVEIPTDKNAPIPTTIIFYFD